MHHLIVFIRYLEYFKSDALFSKWLTKFILRDFVLGTAVALTVFSSSEEVHPSFEEYLKTTVTGI